ncbi:MAG TPA: OpgC domain-containing protein [Candidatus Baltobacteraceae bacterium]|nr:OpgC domain-containing protein [Verrucomicrobiae bacterium]HTX14073.1 OpgC domain-containing protein [Candidatus Baltobacteraceae bacterium]
MKREIELDAVRGFMLAWMTLVHLPTAITPWVNQPFGYISASEGFIFLSALFTGQIYVRVLRRAGPGKMSAKLLLRTLRLYGYHVLLILFVFLGVAGYAVSTHSRNLLNLLDYYFAAGPAHAFLNALLLVYRPPLLDIIPLYIIFLFLSPWIIIAASRIGWKFFLSGSFILWFAAQLGLRQASYAFLAQHFGLRIPLNEMGAFNLWAWQLVWILGMWCGVRWANNDLPVQKWARRAWVPAAIIAAALLVIRYAQLYGLDLGRTAPLFDKWNLGAVRLFDFSALAVLLIRFRSFVKPLAIRPLALLGQSSLQVFCTHFLFCFIGIAMMGNADRIFGWPQAALVVVTFAALLLVAKLRARPELFAHAAAAREPLDLQPPSLQAPSIEAPSQAPSVREPLPAVPSPVQGNDTEFTQAT